MVVFHWIIGSTPSPSQVVDPNTNHTYYWNPTTNKVVWTLPENGVITDDPPPSSTAQSTDASSAKAGSDTDSTYADYYAYYAQAIYGVDTAAQKKEQQSGALSKGKDDGVATKGDDATARSKEEGGAKMSEGGRAKKSGGGAPTVSEEAPLPVSVAAVWDGRRGQVMDRFVLYFFVCMLLVNGWCFLIKAQVIDCRFAHAYTYTHRQERVRSVKWKTRKEVALWSLRPHQCQQKWVWLRSRAFSNRQRLLMTKGKRCVRILTFSLLLYRIRN